MRCDQYSAPDSALGGELAAPRLENPIILGDNYHASLVTTTGQSRIEERLMVATFPDEYPRYTRQVPQLVPGLYLLRQRNAASSHP